MDLLICQLQSPGEGHRSRKNWVQENIVSICWVIFSLLHLKNSWRTPPLVPSVSSPNPYRASPRARSSHPCSSETPRQHHLPWDSQDRFLQAAVCKPGHLFARLDWRRLAEWRDVGRPRHIWRRHLPELPSKRPKCPSRIRIFGAGILELHRSLDVLSNVFLPWTARDPTTWDLPAAVSPAAGVREQDQGVRCPWTFQRSIAIQRYRGAPKSLSCSPPDRHSAHPTSFECLIIGGFTCRPRARRVASGETRPNGLKGWAGLKPPFFFVFCGFSSWKTLKWKKRPPLNPSKDFGFLSPRAFETIVFHPQLPQGLAKWTDMIECGIVLSLLKYVTSSIGGPMIIQGIWRWFHPPLDQTFAENLRSTRRMKWTWTWCFCRQCCQIQNNELLSLE